MSNFTTTSSAGVAAAETCVQRLSAPPASPESGVLKYWNFGFSFGGTARRNFLWSIVASAHYNAVKVDLTATGAYYNRSATAPSSTSAAAAPSQARARPSTTRSTTSSTSASPFCSHQLRYHSSRWYVSSPSFCGCAAAAATASQRLQHASTCAVFANACSCGGPRQLRLQPSTDPKIFAPRAIAEASLRAVDLRKSRPKMSQSSVVSAGWS
mmetsp:Transcript_28947/g.97611  ORF Transcript_28947/g.97611 Transcript_28947/m.97611 type:complete len:212 (+) Transcript_28947:403-1038(+)